MPMPASWRSRNCFGVASSSVVLRSASVFHVERGEDDGDEVAERRENEEARVALGGLEIAGDAEPDEEADVHAGVVPEECSFAARVLRGEALREHHVDASDVEAAAGEEKREADVEQRERAGRDACAAEHLQRHAPDEQVAVRKEAAAQVTAEEVQAVVEGAEHTHQRGGLFHAEMQMLRRVEDQGRVEDGKAERREDLNEEQRGRSLRSRGEKRRLRNFIRRSLSLDALVKLTELCRHIVCAVPFLSVLLLPLTARRVAVKQHASGVSRVVSTSVETATSTPVDSSGRDTLRIAYSCLCIRSALR